MAPGAAERNSGGTDDGDPADGLAHALKLYHQVVQTPVSRIKAAIPEARAIAALGGPLVVNNLVQIGMQVTDTIMAGRLGATDLAAVAVGGAVLMPIWVFGLGVMMALTPTVAHLFGAGKHADIGSWVRQGLWLAVFMTIPTMLALFSASTVFGWFDVDASVVPVSQGYLNAIAFGLPAAFAYLALRFFSEGTSYTRPMMYISMVALPLNIFGNWVFMYGGLGAPAMGAVGCGVATAIVMWAMLGMMVWVVKNRRHYTRFDALARVERPDWRAQRELLWLGIPIGITIFMEGSLFGATALLMGRLGAEVVAGHQIAVNFASVMFMIPMGLSFAISVRIGQALGRGDPVAARHSAKVGIALCAAIMVLSAVNMLLFRHQITGFYTQDAAVLAIASGLIMLAAVFQLSDGVQVAAAGVLRGYKDTRATMVITTIAYWAVGFPLAYWLGIHLGYGAKAIWVGLIAGLSVAAVLLYWRFHRLTYNTRHA